MKRAIPFVFAAMLAGPAVMAQDSQSAAVAAETGAETSAGTGAETSAAASGAAPDPIAPEAVLVPLDATVETLDTFKWVARPIVVFADTPADPRFQEQMELLFARPDGLLERDAVILTDTDPSARSAIRTRLRPRGFMLVLIAKDGTVNLRKPFPWDVREIEHAIDKWPLRQQELREGRSLTD